MEVARNWRTRKQRYSLQGIVCNHCGAPQFPARPVCTQCGGLIGCEAVLLQAEKSLPVAVQLAEKSTVYQSRG